MRFFGLNVPFFLFDTLITFVIRFDLLMRAEAANLGNNAIKYANVTEKLKFFECENVNFTKIDDIVVSLSLIAALPFQYQLLLDSVS